MKKSLSLFLALLMICSAAAVFCLPAAAKTLYGDVNSDGSINKKDSLTLKKYLADNTQTIDLAAADVTADGAVNKKDSLRLKQYLAGWQVILGPEEEPALKKEIFTLSAPMSRITMKATAKRRSNGSYWTSRMTRRCCSANTRWTASRITRK